MPRFWSAIKRFFKYTWAELYNYIHIFDQDLSTTMSKPDKYKAPTEKGLDVPSSAQYSGYSPYTMPYTGTGAVRNEHGNWTQTRLVLVPIAPSHAAPPLYVERKEDEEAAAIARCPVHGNGQGAGKEPSRFHPMYPGVYTRQGPNKR